MYESIGPNTTRLLLALDDAIAACRAGRRCGIAELDTDDFLSAGMNGDAYPARDAPHPASRTMCSSDLGVAGLESAAAEFATLAALAEVYGEPLLSKPSLGRALKVVAQRGAVYLVQRVLWGDCADDKTLAATLDAAIEHFATLVFTWPAIFTAEATAALAPFCLPSIHQRSRL